MEADLAAEAFRRGASGYVLKQSAGTELLLAIHKVDRGESYLFAAYREGNGEISS